MIELFELLTVCRDSHRKAVTDAKRTYAKELAEIQKNYKKGELYKEALQKAKSKMDKAIAKSKGEIKKEMGERLETERSRAESEISTIATKAEVYNTLLSTLKGVIITAREMDLLVAQYGNKSYWTDKLLTSLAIENNLDADNLRLKPSLDIRLNILDEVTGELDTFLNTFPGSDDAKIGDLNLLSDRKIASWEDGYTNCFASGNRLSPIRKAQRAITDILTKTDEYLRGRAIAEHLDKAQGMERRLILSRLNEVNLSDTALKFSGHYSEIKAAPLKEAELASKAEGILAEISKLEPGTDSTRHNISELLYDNIGNDYLIEEATKQAKTNDDIRFALDAALYAHEDKQNADQGDTN